jgi:hypothetical protein
VEERESGEGMRLKSGMRLGGKARVTGGERTDLKAIYGLQ